MKVAIPTEDKKGLDSVIYGHFGSAPYYAVIETGTKTLIFLDNSNMKHEHGQCQPINGLQDNQIEAVVCNGMGARAIQKLNEIGIRVLFGENCPTVAAVIEKIGNNGLREMSVENACQHHHCH